MTDPNRYPSRVFWSDEDQGFIALAPDLPGCSAFGRTQEEAVAQLRDAIEAWQQAAQAVGNPVPEPSKLGLPQHSGKVLLRMPKELHSKLAADAQDQGVSLNHYLVYLITQGQFLQATTMQASNVPIATPVALYPPSSSLRHWHEPMGGSLAWDITSDTSFSVLYLDPQRITAMVPKPWSPPLESRVKTVRRGLHQKARGGSDG